MGKSVGRKSATVDDVAAVEVAALLSGENNLKSLFISYSRQLITGGN